jgi:hypothetical protein
VTRISSASPVRRETDVHYRGRALVVELHPGFLTLKEKGKRYRVSVGYDAILSLGFKLLARAEAAEKKSKGGKR